MKHNKTLAKNSTTGTRPVLRPPDIFGPAPLISGESLVEYDALLARLTASVLPKDVQEEIFVREVADLTWEVRRWRRWKANLLLSSLPLGLERVLEPLLAVNESSLDPAGDLSRAWARREPSARKTVEQLLESAGLTMEAAAAEAFASRLDVFERLERFIANATMRRDHSLREIDRHRETLSRALREATAIEDAEFVDVSAGGAESE